MTIRGFKDEYRFLSNFYPCKIKIKHLEFPSVEHAYQFLKWNPQDPNYLDSRLNVFLRGQPGEAKRLGKRIPLRPDWETKKKEAMRSLLRMKFEDPQLREMLLKTRGRLLVEENTWGDVYWGVCNGKGKNVLGKLLMDTRNDCVFKDEIF